MSIEDTRIRNEGYEQAKADALAVIPTNWLDPLLSGPDKVIHQSPCPEIEKLLTALRARIAKLPE